MNHLDPFAPEEVEDEIKVLPNNKAYGLYSCPVSILKLSSHIISLSPQLKSLMFQYPEALSPLNLKPPKQFQFFNQDMNLSLETIDQFLCYQFLTEYLKSWFIKDLLSLLINIIDYIHHNMDSAVGIVHSTQLQKS